MQKHSARLLKEKGSERLHDTTDMHSHLQLFAAAGLSSPSYRVPWFIHAPVLNIHMRKCFDGENFFMVEQYSSNNFSDNDCHPNIFPL